MRQERRETISCKLSQRVRSCPITKVFVHKPKLHYRSTSICCGFVVQLVVQQIRNNSTTASPQQMKCLQENLQQIHNISTCPRSCVPNLRQVHKYIKCTTIRGNGVHALLSRKLPFQTNLISNAVDPALYITRLVAVFGSTVLSFRSFEATTKNFLKVTNRR